MPTPRMTTQLLQNQKAAAQLSAFALPGPFPGTVTGIISQSPPVFEVQVDDPDISATVRALSVIDIGLFPSDQVTVMRQAGNWIIIAVTASFAPEGVPPEAGEEKPAEPPEETP